ncbi:MAG: cyclic nucleotide-binding domain-containing protein [Hyphomicrobiales bacterium]|nr:cyclic nucleotide-binding domain-containing protein [Hyphomicrobiales bacterium]
MLTTRQSFDSQETICLKEIPLFSKLSRAQIETLWGMLQFTAYHEGEVILAEGDCTRDRIFIIVDGSVAVCKNGRSPLTHEPLEYEVELRERGEVFGAMSVLDGQPLSASMRARSQVTIAILDMKLYRREKRSRRVRNIIVTELRRTLSGYVRSALDHKVDSLRQEAEFWHYRDTVGGIVIAALCLLSAYTLALSAMPSFESYLDVNFALSPFIIFVFGAIFIPVIALSGFPIAFFGLSLHNWRFALLYSVSTSLIFIGVAAILKWALILSSPSLAGVPVLAIGEIRIGDNEPVGIASAWFWGAVGLYLALTPVQEFVARCGVQAPLYAFLQGPEWRRRIWSIFVSNLVFAAAHAHISVEFALIAFIPGIFWGWIFARTNSLLAAAVSHFMVGGATLFLMNFEAFLHRLF